MLEYRWCARESAIRARASGSRCVSEQAVVTWHMRNPILVVVVAIAFAAGAGAQQASSTPVTLAIVNARVWTGNSAQPWAEAVAVSGDRIVMVGTSASVRAAAGTGVRIIDAHGGMVTPGFNDSHVHFMGGGFSLSSVQLRDANTPGKFIARIKAFAAGAPKGAWILGGDWDHSTWGGPLPTREWIDSVTPNNPVWVSRTDGHMQLANSLALKAAGVTRETKDPGGRADHPRRERRADRDPQGQRDGARGRRRPRTAAATRRPGARRRDALHGVESGSRACRTWAPGGTSR